MARQYATVTCKECGATTTGEMGELGPELRTHPCQHVIGADACTVKVCSHCAVFCEGCGEDIYYCDLHVFRVAGRHLCEMCRDTMLRCAMCDQKVTDDQPSVTQFGAKFHTSCYNRMLQQDREAEEGAA